MFLVGIDDDQVGDRATVKVTHEAVALVERLLGGSAVAKAPAEKLKCATVVHDSHLFLRALQRSTIGKGIWLPAFLDFPHLF